LGTLKKKSTKSDHVYYTLKIFENFMFLEDENVPLVLGGLKQAQNMQWHYRRWMGHSQKLASQELSVSLSSRTFLQK
jgi:hypothetical protein